jgi:hypothetical protein
MIEARASHGGVFGIRVLMLVAGCLMLDKRNNLKRMIQYRASSI